MVKEKKKKKKGERDSLDKTWFFGEKKKTFFTAVLF